MTAVWKHLDGQGHEHVIAFRVQRPVADKCAQLLRFQMFSGESTFGCDVLVADRLIADHQLSPETLQRICVHKICLLMARGLREYCMAGVTERDVAMFRDPGQN